MNFFNFLLIFLFSIACATGELPKGKRAEHLKNVFLGKSIFRSFTCFSLLNLYEKGKKKLEHFIFSTFHGSLGTEMFLEGR
jgi:hypothetical protein